MPRQSSSAIPESTQAALDLFVDGDPLPVPAGVAAAVERLASSLNSESLGSIFTRAEVVDFILDLIGYSAELPLHRLRVLEPSFGGGDFLQRLIPRLMRAWQRDGGGDIDQLSACLRGFELHRSTFEATRTVVVSQLIEYGLRPSQAGRVTDAWLHQGDFLLAPVESGFDFVVGNPPYVRQELIPAALLREYRARFLTLYDRADLYIPFIERSLSLLKEGGRLGFICADRWMKNRYGGPLRSMVATGFRLRVYVDMVGTAAFHSEVSAYPAITIIAREAPGPTRVAHRPEISVEGLAALAVTIAKGQLEEGDDEVTEIASVAFGDEPWLLDAPDQMALLRRLEADFPTLEEAGCKVGIGVATGADKAFIGDFDALDVEPDRKLRLVTTKDIAAGEVRWRGQGVINPFEDGGGLVDLEQYPRLKRYLEARKETIGKRHCAQKSPQNWYRTIDRITPSLSAKPKLLIPDIKSDAHIVYEDGQLYPHHNLYFIVSEVWDLRALQAVLMSSITRLFVSSYSTKMRGGFLRFQAQYLRRIRIPHWDSVPPLLRIELAAAALLCDPARRDRAVFQLYRLTAEERFALGGNGD